MNLEPDRLFPADPATRDLARELYGLVAGLPILSTHGHVDPGLLVRDEPFPDPAKLFVQDDHYVTRLLHSAGIGLDSLGLPQRDGAAATVSQREVWRSFCANWQLYAGTASGYWLSTQFAQLFGIHDELGEARADSTYDLISAALETAEFRPRALFERFGIEVMATTDDPMSDLSEHAALAADPAFAGRVLPTFRPDTYLDPSAPGWAERIQAMTEAHGAGRPGYSAYIESLAARRRYFVEHGAVSADHGVVEPFSTELSASDAGALFDRALTGDLSPAERRAFAGHMLMEMARMSVEDGLVMTVHAGVHRNHSPETFERFGPDTGHDIPIPTSFVDNLKPLLSRYGNDPALHLVLFSVDESVYSRELAPLAGFYPSVYIGAPWWFLDAPDAVLRFKAAVTETAGFYRGAGFIDDTRAFLSIPARHDMARRLDSAFLARLVREGRIGLPMAERIAVDLVDSIPRGVFKL